MEIELGSATSYTVEYVFGATESSPASVSLFAEATDDRAVVEIERFHVSPPDTIIDEIITNGVVSVPYVPTGMAVRLHFNIKFAGATMKTYTVNITTSRAKPSV